MLVNIAFFSLMEAPYQLREIFEEGIVSEIEFEFDPVYKTLGG